MSAASSASPSPALRVIGPLSSRSGRTFERLGSLVSPALGTDAADRPTFYVETYGCEMNQYDSEFIASRFLDEGWAPASSPETADVLLFNTCSVRAGAEERVRARVASFSGVKARRPKMILGIVGCMAQRLGEELVDDRGLVDLVAGTETYRELPSLVKERREQGKGSLVATPEDATRTYAIERPVAPKTSPVAFLTIQQGCDKFCTFCIVPFTRGRERSKPCADVVAEARRLVEGGAKQITLLGQNVNSYRDGDVSFAGLLRALDDVDGLERLHFTSSYPRDMTEDVFRAIAECRAPIEFLHFPVQSGSDAVLKRMKRRHTVDWYLRKVDEARRIVPDLQLSTDLIVGFPGETEADFRETLRLVERVRYAECFMYRYSPREGTPAIRLADSLPEEEKARRLEELIALQRSIVRDVLEENLGRTMEVLVEGPSSRNPRETFGRTRNRFMVVLPEGAAEPGDLVPVVLAERSGSTYRGIPVEWGNMGFLRVVRAALVMALVVCAIGIAVRNPAEKVTIDLLFGPPYTDVPLVFALFVAFLVGGVGGCAVALLWIVELQAKLRDARRQSRRLQSELTSLRNLPLDETDDVPVEART